MGAAQRKARSAKWVLVNGLYSSSAVDERRRRAGSRAQRETRASRSVVFHGASVPGPWNSPRYHLTFNTCFQSFICHSVLIQCTISISMFVVGKLPKNHEVLREAYSLCHRLPIMNTPKFREEFYSVCYPHFWLSIIVELSFKKKRVKSVNETPSQSYGMSLATCSICSPCNHRLRSSAALL